MEAPIFRQTNLPSSTAGRLEVYEDSRCEARCQVLNELPGAATSMLSQKGLSVVMPEQLEPELP